MLWFLKFEKLLNKFDESQQNECVDNKRNIFPMEDQNFLLRCDCIYSFDPIVAKYNMSQVRLSAYQLVSCFIAWKPEDDQTKEYFTPSQHPQDRQRTALCPPSLHCILIWCFGCSFVCPQVRVHKCAKTHSILNENL